MDEDPTLWGYWKDKHGLKEAIEFQYPNTLANDPTLRHALAQIQAGELALNARMEQLKDKVYEAWEGDDESD